MEYLKRITSTPKKIDIIIWWVFRALLLYAFVRGFFRVPFDITDPLQVGANFLCTFVWEVFMLLPKSNSLRYVDPRVQTFLIIGIFCGSFCGKYLNWYYDFRWWDVMLHFIGGGACVFYGHAEKGKVRHTAFNSFALRYGLFFPRFDGVGAF